MTDPNSHPILTARAPFVKSARQQAKNGHQPFYKPNPDSFTKAKRNGQEPVSRPHTKNATLSHLADLLIEQHGPFICFGRHWWRWNGNIWEEIDSSQYLRFCVNIQPPGNHRTNRIANDILETAQQKCQVNPAAITWRYGIGFKNEDTVIINALNGVVRVNLASHSFELIEPDPAHLAIAQLPVLFDGEAKCPTFDYLLSSCLPSPEDQYLLQCFMGYCLLPDHRFQCMLFCYGVPNSGKSLLIYHGLGSVFGRELMSNVSLEDVCKRGDELRDLEKSLVNVGTEIEGRLLDSKIFNQIVIGERINAALKYEKSRRIESRCKFINNGNHYPKFKRGSDAEARRIEVLCFPCDFSDRPKDGKLEAKVKSEGSGMLNWMIAGLLAVAKLEQMPKGSQDSQAHYQYFQTHNNPAKKFVKTFCERSPEYRMRSADYAQAISIWARHNDISFGANVEHTKVLKEMYIEIKSGSLRVGGEKCRALLGIRLNRAGEELLTTRFAKEL